MISGFAIWSLSAKIVHDYYAFIIIKESRWQYIQNCKVIPPQSLLEIQVIHSIESLPYSAAASSSSASSFSSALEKRCGGALRRLGRPPAGEDDEARPFGDGDVGSLF